MANHMINGRDKNVIRMNRWWIFLHLLLSVSKGVSADETLLFPNYFALGTGTGTRIVAIREQRVGAIDRHRD